MPAPSPSADNPWNGESSFEWRGKRYTMRLGMSTLARLDGEEKLGIPKLMQILGDPTAPGFLPLFITAAWIAIHRKHPEISREDVEDMVDDLGLEMVRDAFSTANTNAFPPSKDGGAAPAGEPANPPPADGTGPA